METLAQTLPLLFDNNAFTEKRKRVSQACASCQRSHLSCDHGRPCSRCAKKGLGHLCVDGAQKKRGKKPVRVSKRELTREDSPRPVKRIRTMPEALDYRALPFIKAELSPMSSPQRLNLSGSPAVRSISLSTGTVTEVDSDCDTESTRSSFSLPNGCIPFTTLPACFVYQALTPSHVIMRDANDLLLTDSDSNPGSEEDLTQLELSALEVLTNMTKS